MYLHTGTTYIQPNGLRLHKILKHLWTDKKYELVLE